MSLISVKYSKENLISIIRPAAPESLASAKNKTHLEYLHAYLSKPPVCRTIMVEREYVDRNFLIDHSLYYNRNFQNVEKRCVRLHFFKDEISHREALQLVTRVQNSRDINSSIEDDDKRLQAAYLGNLVVTPLPGAVFGRTLLKPKDSYLNNNYLSASTKSIDLTFKFKKALTTSHRANLHGVELGVISSPFIEQDTVVSACATASLWGFLEVNPDFTGRVPAPSEITTIANDGEYGSYPSLGLSHEQIVKVLKELNLEPRYKDLSTNNLLMHTRFQQDLFSFLTANYPILCGVSLFERDESGNIAFKDRHAINVVGFSHSKTPDREQNLASYTNKVLIHDDQSGPYIKCNLLKVVIEKKTAGQTFCTKLKEVHERIRQKLNCEDSEQNCSLFSFDLREDKDKPKEEVCVLHATLPTENDHRQVYYVLENYYLSGNQKIRLPSSAAYQYTDYVAKFITKQAFDNAFGKQLLDSPELGKNLPVQKRNSLLEGYESKIPVQYQTFLARSNDYKSSLRKLECNSPKKPLIDELLICSWPKYVWISRFYFLDKLSFDLIFDSTSSARSDPIYQLVVWDENMLKMIEKMLENYTEDSKKDDNKYKDDVFIASLFRGLNRLLTGSPLDEKFGPLRLARTIHPNEFDLPKFEHPNELELDLPNKQTLQESASYIWLIDREGKPRLAKEVQKKVGHGALSRGELCRCAGEVKLNDKDLYFNSRSGRFHGGYTHIDKLEHYQNAALLISQYLANKVTKIHLEYSHEENPDTSTENSVYDFDLDAPEWVVEETID
jgi:hypothetical protein